MYRGDISEGPISDCRQTFNFDGIALEAPLLKTNYCITETSHLFKIPLPKLFEKLRLGFELMYGATFFQDEKRTTQTHLKRSWYRCV